MINQPEHKTVTYPECGGSASEDTDGTLTCHDCGYAPVVEAQEEDERDMPSSCADERIS